MIGIDIRETSVNHTLALKKKYNLSNLDVYPTPIERVEALGDSAVIGNIYTGKVVRIADFGAFAMSNRRHQSRSLSTCVAQEKKFITQGVISL